MRCGVWVLLAILLGLLAATGCGVSDNGGNGPVTDYNRKTPDNLLNFFGYAYEEEDPELYDEALDFYFEFEFTDEVADSLGLPKDSPWWGKEEDKASTENMFDDAHVKKIEFHLERSGVGSDWEDCWREFITDDPPETTLIQGVCEIFEPEIKVYIEEPGEEERILWVHESLLDIMVRPDPEQPELWTILRIKETKKNPFAASTQLSEIKTRGL
jgi:hypothetical protein